MTVCGYSLLSDESLLRPRIAAHINDAATMRGKLVVRRLQSDSKEVVERLRR